MLRLLKKKPFLLFVITVVLFIVMGITSQNNSKLAWFSNLFNTAVSPIQNVLTFSGNKVDKTLSFFNDNKVVREENEKLKKRIDELEKENEDLKKLKSRNDVLMEALNLKNQLKEFDYISANIIAKDPGNWFNIFTIDRGSNNNVNNNSVVVASRGLVGRVMVSGPFSSKVISIIDIDSAVSARITKNSEYVDVKGEISLRDKGLCKMYNIRPGADIAVGDSVETSGIGGIFPKGIKIGEVKEIRQVNNELDRYAIIEPVVDFRRLEDVFVLKSKK
ncbi:rod shape-determining protein MreC [Pseudobacteroides cellulosolvens]|uniref:Cell shape-determining protein MreC n=1 Tax=Pseudobacteroides cellulosolvens ATCC 35603 = DSM 2933 TaxID=398512 RepID=A0A0L6JMV1_9FIRM|nr:rod shape-determining protein MreC [Pseudobacteroides cellulosolvens]KNY27089.1 rod shape-determining protein MreC [Pseudobacteroides cellulosolvens ATCC 35603 = DSM 2933]